MKMQKFVTRFFFLKKNGAHWMLEHTNGICGRVRELSCGVSALLLPAYECGGSNSGGQACVAQPAETTCCPDMNFTILLFISFFSLLNPGLAHAR